MLKALKKPPDLIKRLFDCVLILFQELVLIECETVDGQAAAARRLVEGRDCR